MFKQPISDKEEEKIKAAMGDDQTEWEEGPLKELLVNYVGSSTGSEDITTEMIVEVMSKEFPEFLMVVAEQNWIRGYHQAIHDVDQGQKLIEEYNEQDTDGNS